jgi:exodeoxyribonuclease X
MSLALAIDTETTGFDAPEVISLATTIPLPAPVSDLEEIPVALQMFRPSKPISLGALATHHIIEEDLRDCAPWPGSWTPPAGVEYLIGHHVDYDWEAIGSPHVARICTLVLSRSLWPDLDSHSLGALTYQFQGRVRARELLKHAHSADHDVGLCLLQLREILRALPGIQTWHQLWQASEKARVPVRIGFGKFGPHEAWAKANGGAMRCAEIRNYDPGYYRWLLNSCDQVQKDPYLRKALTGEPA